jgi:DNA repair photolyase
MDLIDCRSIFSDATGFVKRGGFDKTCNPYVGCTFGCLYCYAAFLPQNRRPVSEWGRWLTAKQNAVEVAQKTAPKLAGQALYMSSVTDPYQPVERSLFLTRGILEALVAHQPRMVIQTRGPMVVRDIDILTQFRCIRVNVSICTDSDEVWQAFEPKSPPLERRWQALVELRAAGIPVGICVTPMLPVANPKAFAQRLLDFRPDLLVTQEFHNAGGKFGADTGDAARQLLSENGWSNSDYLRTRELLRREMPVYEGEAGFFPP